jgi:predicted short-subunit dehydrogenase-like oxidoreductase (DUF2520 family)
MDEFHQRRAVQSNDEIHNAAPGAKRASSRRVDPNDKAGNPPVAQSRGRGSRRLPNVSLIGAGNWGSALALALHDAGVRVPEIVVRTKSRSYLSLAGSVGARLVTIDEAKLLSEVWWICTPDRLIAGVAAELHGRLAQIRAKNQLPGMQAQLHGLAPIVFHSSGALSSAELAPLRAVHAALASVHPLMTFPRSSHPRRTRPPHALTGVPFAVEGDPRAIHAARRLIRAMRGETFTLPRRSKALYHAFGAFISPLLVALLAAAVETAATAGWSRIQTQRRMRPIVERTIANFFANGPEKSFSGPIARGDAVTIVRHLKALAAHPQLAAVYRELSRVALDTIPSPSPAQIRQILDRAAARSVGASRPKTV